MKDAESYDAVAEAYAERYLRELESKPLDRALLSAYADTWIANGSAGVVADIGCGPGQVARFLHDRGVATCGIDLSARMCELARAARDLILRSWRVDLPPLD